MLDNVIDMKKVLAILSFVLVSSFGAYAQEKSCLPLQDRVEITFGVGYRYYNAHFSSDINHSGFLCGGIKFNFFEKTVFMDFDYSMSVPNEKYRDFFSGINLKLKVANFKKSYIDLGIRWQSDNVFFSRNRDKNIKEASSLGPVLEFRNRAWSLEAFYGFGLNSYTNYDNKNQHLGILNIKAAVNIPINK